MNEGVVGWETYRFRWEDRYWDQLEVLAEMTYKRFKIRPGRWVVVRFDNTEDEFAYVCDIRKHGDDVLLCVSLAVDLERNDSNNNYPPQLAVAKALRADDLITSTDLRIVSVSHVREVVTQREEHGVVRDVLDVLKDSQDDDTDVSLCRSLVWDTKRGDIIVSLIMQFSRSFKASADSYEDGSLKLGGPQPPLAPPAVADVTRSGTKKSTAKTSTKSARTGATQSGSDRVLRNTYKSTAKAAATSTEKSTGKTATRGPSGGVKKQTKQAAINLHTDLLMPKTRSKKAGAKSKTGKTPTRRK